MSDVKLSRLEHDQAHICQWILCARPARRVTFIRREGQIYLTAEHSRSMATVVDTRQRCGAERKQAPNPRSGHGCTIMEQSFSAMPLEVWRMSPCRRIAATWKTLLP